MRLSLSCPMNMSLGACPASASPYDLPGRAALIIGLAIVTVSHFCPCNIRTNGSSGRDTESRCQLI